ncbi:MAG TPA: DUF4199 domain-containing protein [Pyrinomonadaceae bacterium]|nr:DUF4199 domain-containing protein [Pyrinomonadaceae bacterium]
MKKTVLKFGLIAGGIFVAVMFSTMPFLDQIGFEYGEVIGYTMLLAAFAFIFVGIRSYRENVGNGYITFGRAFKIGILITVIASLCYVISWQIVYYGFVPDFGEKYTQYLAEKSRAAGASPDEVAKEVAEMQRFMALYKNPVYNFLITFFVEPLPMGLFITLISAAILRKRPKEVPNGAELVSTP